MFSFKLGKKNPPVLNNFSHPKLVFVSKALLIIDVDKTF